MNSERNAIELGALQSSEAIELAQKLLNSAKYRAICPATIVDIISKESNALDVKNVFEKRVRERLHRVAALYLEKQSYKKLRKMLEGAAALCDSDRQQVYSHILSQHASTAERMQSLSETYQQLWKITGMPQTVLDLAAAFHPFGFTWMGLDRKLVSYLAYDINLQFVELLNLFFSIEGINGRAELQDVLVQPPGESLVDVALLLKMFHCIENREAGCGLRLLRSLRARSVIVSFPRSSLGSADRKVGAKHIETIRRFCLEEQLELCECNSPDEHFLVLTYPDAILQSN